MGSMLTALAVSPVAAQNGIDLIGDKFGTIQCSRLEVADETGEMRVLLSINEQAGRVAVLDRDGKSKAVPRTDEHGGGVGVYGKDGKAKAGMGINQSGGGFVSTWDKFDRRKKPKQCTDGDRA